MLKLFAFLLLGLVTFSTCASVISATETSAVRVAAVQDLH